MSRMSDSLIAPFLADRDERCPKCGQNLRGLQSNRCAECGLKLELGLKPAPLPLGLWLTGAIGLCIGLSMIIAWLAVVFLPWLDTPVGYFPAWPFLLLAVLVGMVAIWSRCARVICHLPVFAAIPLVVLCWMIGTAAAVTLVVDLRLLVI